MRSPAHALLWELWRISRWEIVCRIVGVSVLWVSIFYLVDTLPAGSVIALHLTSLVLMLLLCTSLFSALWVNNFDNKQHGFHFYLGFTRPISTPLLVAAPMVYIACTAAVCYLVPATLLRVLFDLPLPLVPMAAVTAAACTGFVMAAWSSQTILARGLSFMATIFFYLAVAAILLIRHPGAFDQLVDSPESLLAAFSFSAWHYTMLLLFFVAAVAITVYAVDRQRHGDKLEIRLFARAFSGRVNKLPKGRRAFSTPGKAQFWFEMRRSGTPVLFFSLVGAPAAFFGLLLLNAFGDFRDVAGNIWLFLLGFCPVFFLLMGAEWLLGMKRKQGAVSMSTFDATQAMGNSRLMLTKLAVLTTSVLAGWLILACAAAIWLSLWGDPQVWSDPAAAEKFAPILTGVPLLWWAGIAVVAVILYVSGIAMLLTFGLWSHTHPWISVVAISVTYCYFALAALDAKLGWLPRAFWDVHAWALAIAFMIGTTLALRAALRWGFLPKGYFVVALCSWAAYVCVVLTVYLTVATEIVQLPLSVTALGLASLTLPLASVALAPLALASCRHR